MLGHDFLRTGFQRGSAFGDLNNDGFPDLVVTSLNEAPRILINSADNGNHWLALELTERAWSIKEMHRLMLRSSAYQQSAHAARETLAKDPGNRLLARGPRYRLDAETLRDQAHGIDPRPVEPHRPPQSAHPGSMHLCFVHVGRAVPLLCELVRPPRR